MPNKVQSIKEEIERLKNEQLSIFSKGESVEICGTALDYIGIYNQLLSFIDSLPEESKCIYNRTLDERKKFCRYCSAACSVRVEEEPVSDLEEACDNYYDETWDEHGGIAMVVNNCHDIWFPSQATSDFFKAGAEWQKQQMMSKAIDALVHTFDNGYIRVGTQLLANNKYGLKVGDKAKVIIIKDEQL